MLKDKVATFEKVSRERFVEDVLPYIKSMYKYDDEKSRYLAEDLYEKIKIPARSTKESAGYDFFAYDNITLKKGIGLAIPLIILRLKKESGLQSLLVSDAELIVDIV